MPWSPQLVANPTPSSLCYLLFYQSLPCLSSKLLIAYYFVCVAKAWFSYVRKIPDDQGFYFLATIPDFADITDIRQRSVPDFPDYEFGGGEMQ